MSRILDDNGMPKEFKEYLLRYFGLADIKGDGWCYYRAVFRGIMHGLNEGEKQILRERAGIADYLAFHSALKKYFVEKTKRIENESIIVQRETSGKMRRIKLSNRMYNSLTEGATCQDYWGTTDINGIVSGFFVETFNIDIDIFVLFHEEKQNGWRWTKNRNKRILISETGKITVFLLLNRARDHFYTLLPKAGIREIPMQYSFKEREKAQQSAGNTGYISDSDDGEGFNPNSLSSKFSQPQKTQPQKRQQKRKRETFDLTKSKERHIRFNDSSDSDSDSDYEPDTKVSAATNNLKLKY